MYLYELFDRTLPYKWAVDLNEEKRAEFSLEDGVHYSVRFYFREYQGSLWEVFFRMEANPNLSAEELGNGISDMGTGNEFLVFATVRKIIIEFLQGVKPPVWYFTADSSEASRVKLYDRFTKEIQQKHGYSVEKELTQENNIMYYFEKK